MRPDTIVLLTTAVVISATPAAAQTYLGTWSSNRYSSDSVNNPYGAGSPYHQDSPRNPYGEGLSIFSDDD